MFVIFVNFKFIMMVDHILKSLSFLYQFSLLYKLVIMSATLFLV